MGGRALSRAGRVDRRARSRDRVARLRAPAGLRPDARRLPRRRPPREGAHRRGSRRAGGRLSRAELLDHRAIAVGARRPDRGRLPLRREHLPDPSRSLRHSRRAALAARHRRAPGAACSKCRDRRCGWAAPICRSPAAATSASCRTRWTRWGMRRVNQVEGQPAIFYLHPWEIDPEQPRLPASVLGRFRHYRNLHLTEARLRSLMRDFSFGPLADGPRRLRGMTAVRSEETRERSRPRSPCVSDVPASELDRYVARPPGRDRLPSVRAGAASSSARSATRRSTLAAVSHDGHRQGVLPLVFFRSRLFGRFAVSLPFVNYGGVVADAPRCGRALVDRAVEETRARAARTSSCATRRAALPRTGAEAPQGRDAAAARRAIRAPVGRARPQGPQPGPQGREERAARSTHGGAELVDDFYAVFAHNMRDLGTPVYGKALLRGGAADVRRHRADLRRASPGRGRSPPRSSTGTAR